MAENHTDLEKNSVARIEFRLAPELKDRIGKAADIEGLPMNEFMANVLAASLGCPELSRIPRKSIGRPRKPATNGKTNTHAKPANGHHRKNGK